MSGRLVLSRLRSARWLSVVSSCNSTQIPVFFHCDAPVTGPFKIQSSTPLTSANSPPCSSWLSTAFRDISNSRPSWTAAVGDPAGNIVSFPLAQTGEGISECELMQWFVKEGDDVEEFQPICEVQSDKAAIEITSRHSGTIVKVHHSQGELVKVGAPLVDIQLTAGAAAAAAGAVDAPDVATSSSDSDQSGGNGSASGIRAAPTVRRLARELGVDLAKVPGTGPDGRVLREDVERFKAGLTSRIADKLVDRIAQTAGPRSTADLYAAAEEPRFEGSLEPAADAQPAESSGGFNLAAAAAATAHAGGGTAAAQPPQGSTRIPVRGYRRAMIKSSVEAAAIPTFHYMDELYVDGLLHVRHLLKNDPILAGTKLTYLPFVVKALSITLGEYPAVNCSLEAGGQALLQHHTHNIGVAMATGNGLVVPNVKQVEHRSVPEIAQELARLQHLAAAGKLSTDEVSNGSITISNIGTVGGTNATPMLNPPEAAILALGRVQALPRYDPTGENIVKRNVMSVSWGGDHRVIDGATIAEFSNYWKHLLEEPGRFLMHLR